MSDHPTPPPIDPGSIGKGFGIGAGLNVLQGALTLVAAWAASPNGSGLLVLGIVAFGLIQLVYVIPLFFHWRNRGKTANAKGLAIEASIVLLINVTCGAIAFGKMASIG